MRAGIRGSGLFDGVAAVATVRLALVAAGCLGVTGCGYFGGDEESAEDPPPPVAAPVANIGMLELNLKVGDRFPLMKTVVQELNQASSLGPAASRSRIELLLTLTVEEILPEKKRLAVRYNRVRCSQDVAGESFEFDSSVVRGKVPRAALPYLGLIGNGFSFWIGRDNQVIEPVGFSEFLTRCVRDVPEEDRALVLSRFSQTTADEGIANFVDDSIGLLPYASGDKGSKVVEGDTWTRERRLLQPMPLYLKHRYTLKTLNEHVAEIDVLGTIAPSTTYDPQNTPSSIVLAGAEQPDGQDPKKPRVIVRGGNAFGSCTIDRGTGLPLESHVERHLNMVVRMPDGLEFEQRKRTVTTIQAFPQQRAEGDSPPDAGGLIPPRTITPANPLERAGSRPAEGNSPRDRR